MAKDSKKRIAFVLRNAPPNYTTNVSLLMQVVVALADRGHQVAVHASRPPAASMNASKFEHAGVALHYYYTPNFNNDAIWGRLINMFVTDTLILVRLLFTRRLDVLVPDTTSIFAGLVAWAVSLVRRVPYVYVTTEVYPDVPINMGLIGRNGLIARLWRIAAKLALRRAATTIAVCEAENKLLQKYVKPHDFGKMKIVSNWANVDEIKPIEPAKNDFLSQPPFQAKLVLVYAGRIGRSHDTETVIQTAILLKENADISFVFVGGGKNLDDLSAQVGRLGLKNVHFLPYQPQAKLNQLLSAGSMSLVTLKPKIYTIPSRIYPAMAAGQPLLAITPADTGLGEFVEGSDFGMRFDNGEAQKIADYLTDLVENPSNLARMRTHARKVVEKRHSHKVSVPQYVAIIESVLKREKEVNE